MQTFRWCADSANTDIICLRYCFCARRMHGPCSHFYCHGSMHVTNSSHLLIPHPHYQLLLVAAMATIDHLSFPHIIDAIISHPESWLALRTTSRDYYQRIEKQLFRHVALSSTCQPAETLDSDLPAPCIVHPSPIFSLNIYWRKVDDICCTDLHNRITTYGISPTIIDVPCNLSWYLLATFRAPTTRLLCSTPDCSLIPLETEVLAKVVTFSNAERDEVPGRYSSLRSSKTVVNISFETGRRWRLVFNEVESPQIVYIFHPKRGVVVKPFLARCNRIDVDTFRQRLCTRLADAAVSNQPCKIILVDWPGYEVEFGRYFYDLVGYELEGRGYSAELAPGVCNRCLVFMSGQQYRASLRPGEWEEETSVPMSRFV